MTSPAVNIYNEDCISGIRKRLQPGSVSLTVSSIPFEELFVYSGKIEDVGGNGSTVDIRGGRFILNLRFVVDALFWAHAPGTVCCIHVQQLLAYKNQHGFMGRRHFTSAVVDAFSAGGFEWTGEFVIAKDPQAVANRLSLHSLQFRTGRERDACLLAPVFNDYVLIFKKPGENPHPVRPFYHPRKNPTGWIKPDKGGIICPDWVQYAQGTWADVQETDVLAGYKSAGDPTDERHVCPLQLRVIYRLVRLYSNPVTLQPDVLVLDPFMGIGSTAYVCLGGSGQLGDTLEAPRNVAGFELKESYHRQALANVAKLGRKQKRAAAQGDLLAGVK